MEKHGNSPWSCNWQALAEERFSSHADFLVFEEVVCVLGRDSSSICRWKTGYCVQEVLAHTEIKTRSCLCNPEGKKRLKKLLQMKFGRLIENIKKLEKFRMESTDVIACFEDVLAYFRCLQYLLYFRHFFSFRLRQWRSCRCRMIGFPS